MGDMHRLDSGASGCCSQTAYNPWHSHGTSGSFLLRSVWLMFLILACMGPGAGSRSSPWESTVLRMLYKQRAGCSISSPCGKDRAAPND